jgi:hypothetical protein
MPLGRKRKPGSRTPNGKLRPDRPAPLPVLPHRRGYGSDPRATTQHGRFLLDGVINGPQFVAGEIYLVSLAKYRAAILAPHGLRSASEGSAKRVCDEEFEIEIVERFEVVRRALGRLITHVERVLCHEQRPADPTGYRAGLDVLRGVYGV